MKKFAIVLFLAICFLPFLSGQKSRIGELPKVRPGVAYPLQVHISRIRIRNCQARVANGPCEIYADSIIDGKKKELMGTDVSYPSYKQFKILPGNYEARLLKNPHSADGTELRREYEVVLPGKVIWHCTVSGISE
jgi:hypothetical protein